MKKKLVDSILISALVTALNAGIALLFTDTESTWYLALQKPVLQPPAWVFAVAWTAVYLLFAVSLTFAQLGGANGKTYVFYGAQVLFNILWCLFFFTLHMPYSGLAIIIAYAVSTYLAIRTVYKYSKTAAFTLLPQGLWLVFAGLLNYMIILQN